MPQVDNPVLYVRSRGKALYAVVCDINDATRSSHADYYSIYEFLRQTENYKWMDFEAISRLAIKWAFAYTQNINLYDFSPDYGRFLYISELFGRVVNDGNGIANIKDPVLYIFKTRGKSFGLGYRDSSAVKNTSTSRVYAVEPLMVVDVNLYEQYSCLLSIDNIMVDHHNLFLDNQYVNMYEYYQLACQYNLMLMPK
jgi:hypothetical protein